MNRPGRRTLLLAMALLVLPLPAAAVVTTFDVTAPSEAVPEVTLQIFDADEPETVVEERKVESEGTVEVELDEDRSYGVRIKGGPVLVERFQGGEDLSLAIPMAFARAAPGVPGEGGPQAAGGGAPATTPQRPRGVGLSGGLVTQRLPKNSGDLGVVGVGFGERAFLSLPDTVYMGGVGLDGTVPIPQICGLEPVLRIDSVYGYGMRSRDRMLMGQSGWVNGITYWGPAADSSEGISSTGAGLTGETEVELHIFDFNAGLQLDVTPFVEDALANLINGDGAPGQAATELDGLGRFYLEGGAGFGKIRQKTEQTVRLTQMDPGFSLFNVYSQNDLDLTEWNFLTWLGGAYSHPIRQVPGLNVVVGTRFGIGFYDANGDGDQHNFCDVRFAVDPGTNVCGPAIQDFMLDADFNDSGFDWRAGFQAGIEYDLDFVWAGLSADLGYSFDYVGVSRIELPTNLGVDSPPDIKRTNEARHSFGVTLTLNF